MSMKSTPCSTAARTTRDGAGPVGRLAPDAGAGQLHGAVAEAVDGQVPADGEGVAQLRSGHASGQHGEPARVFPAACSMAAMGEIVVLRHGQTEWSRSGQHTGVTDLPLLPEGEEQAQAPADVAGRAPLRRGVGQPAAAGRPDGRAGRADADAASTTTWSRSTTAATRAGRRPRSARSSAASGRSGGTAPCPATTPGRDAGRRRRRAWTGCSTGPGSGWPTATSRWSRTATCSAC